MRQLFFRLKAAWLYSRVHPFVPALPEDFWLPEDSKAHQTYLTSSTGRKWALLMLRHVQSAAFRAIIERNHATYECGYASGCRGLMATSDALLPQISPSQSESETGNPKEKDIQEFLEMYSP